MKIENVLLLIGAQLSLDGNELIQYANEDTIGGYHNNPAYATWPGGSMWESEGRIIYALIRALKPETVIELGAFVGCSASHMAAAVMRNGSGKVYSLDSGRAGAAHGSLIPDNLKHLVTLISADGIEWLEAQDDNSLDFLLEDMMHDTPSVKVVAELAMKKLKPGGLLINHDASHDFAWIDTQGNKTNSPEGAAVREGLRQANVEYRAYITDESDCGLSVAQKPQGALMRGVEPYIEPGFVPDKYSVKTSDSIANGTSEPEKPARKKPGRKPKAAK